MKALDCSSLDSTVRSLEHILGVPGDVLRRKLQGFDFEHYADSRRSKGLAPSLYESAVLHEIAGENRDEILIPEAIIWFHSTRVLRTTDFRSTGLKPLKVCLPAIKEMLTQIVEELGGRKAGGSNGFSGSFSAKMQHLEQQGPDAFLIRDAAIHHSQGRCHFLDAPEIVKELAECMAGGAAQSVLDAYRQRTAPCIVKFVSRIPRSDVLKWAAAYAHACLHGDPDPGCYHTCFGGSGEAIPSSDILDVEWL